MLQEAIEILNLDNMEAICFAWASLEACWIRAKVRTPTLGVRSMEVAQRGHLAAWIWWKLRVL